MGRLRASFESLPLGGNVLGKPCYGGGLSLQDIELKMGHPSSADKFVGLYVWKDGKEEVCIAINKKGLCIDSWTT
jgi:hypothetical protein